MTADRPLPAISLAVVGVAFANPDKAKSNRRFEIALCVPGDPIELRPEPKNMADPRAVAVYSSRGVQIGYLTAERCGRIGAIIREGREYRAVFQSAAKHGAWIRVAFDGEVPVVADEEPSKPSLQSQVCVDVDPDPGIWLDEGWGEHQW